MKAIITLLTILIHQISIAQFSNMQFSDWEIAEDIGQDYEIPSNWSTNNSLQGNGFATTPVTKLVSDSGNGFIAKVESNFHTTSTLEKGILYQKSISPKLDLIWYKSKCDSLHQGGNCVTSIIGNDNIILYTDTIYSEEDDFSVHEIDIPLLWQDNYESLTLQFEAVGRTIPEDPTISSYAVLLVEEIGFGILLNTENINRDHDLLRSPNPTNNLIKIHLDEANENDIIRISDIYGIVVYENRYTPNIEVGHLENGIYFITYIGKKGSQSYSFMKTN